MHTHECIYTWTRRIRTPTGGERIYHSEGLCPPGQQSPGFFVQTWSPFQAALQMKLAKAGICQMGHKISKVGEGMRTCLRWRIHQFFRSVHGETW